MPGAKVTLKGKVLAESDETIVIEGNHHFPPDSVDREAFIENERHTTCHWKGVASYYDVVADGEGAASAP